MLANSLRTRGIEVAYLFGPPRFVPRDEASQVHGRVCDALHYDDLTFRYSTSETPIPVPASQSKGFSITFERKEGRGAYAVTIDNPGVFNPIRLLLGYTWPQSLEQAKEQFDLTSEAVFSGLKGPWQLVMVEVRLRTQCSVQQDDALQFITSKMLRLSPEWLTSLGQPLALGSLKFEVEAGPPVKPLSNPKRELSIEVLREDPSCLYLELMSQWQQFAVMPRGTTIEVANLRQIESKPSVYISEALTYLRDRIEDLAREGSST